MKNIYCTLFNYGYLTRGLALYRSMERCINDFRLYILAMDQETKEVLDGQKLSNATIIDVDEVLDDSLKAVLGGRIGPSFFWTCTPLIIEYVLKERNEHWCTYVDADCYFLKDTGRVFDIIEKDNYSVGIVEHRFRKDGIYNSLINSEGRFNVAFNTFRNEENSLRILIEWKKQCIECCTNAPTDGNFGDQLYLNEWPDKFDGIYIIEDDGVDVAPWNVSNYRFSRTGQSYRIENDTDSYEVSMYHFQALRLVSPHLASLNLWNTKSRSEQKHIYELYREYINELRHQQEIVDRFQKPAHEIERKSIVCKIRSIYSKYKNRMDNSIVGILRNVMWV